MMTTRITKCGVKVVTKRTQDQQRKIRFLDDQVAGDLQNQPTSDLRNPQRLFASSAMAALDFNGFTQAISSGLVAISRWSSVRSHSRTLAPQKHRKSTSAQPGVLLKPTRWTEKPWKNNERSILVKSNFAFYSNNRLLLNSFFQGRGSQMSSNFAISNHAPLAAI